MKTLRNLAICLFIAELLVLVLWTNLDKPRLLILHSYNDDYNWVQGVNVGLRRVLGQDSGWSVRWHYLDTKRHPWPEHKANAGQGARRLIGVWRPDVVIAIDDDAQAFVARHLVDRTDLSVVFAGVNNERKDYGYDRATNVTGILERLPLEAVKEGLVTLAASRPRPGPLRLAFLGDRSETVTGDARWIQAHDWAPLVLVDTVLVDTLDEWNAAVDRLSGSADTGSAATGSADFILTSNYRRIAQTAGSKELVPAAELIAQTCQRSRVPLIGTNVFFVDDGGMIAIATSPLEQGEVAAAMSRKILDQRQRASDIPVQHTRQFVVALSGSRLKASGLSLPRIYEATARASGYFRE